MTDRETHLLEQWRRDEPIFAAWGRYVGHAVCDAIAELIIPTELNLFLRMPVKSRTKQGASLIEKAFYRNKGYADPYGEIEDKVGIRFVVLLSDDIRTIEAAIISEDRMWRAQKARDFLDEREERPFEFDYQSLHYVVRSRAPFVFDGVNIPEQTPCEVQVRTLLQHAYSELTHDTIYKPSVQATPEMKRAAAKSMALIEVTDDYFTDVSKLIKDITAVTDRINIFMSQIYAREIGFSPQDGALNSLLIDHYSKFADDDFEGKFDDWLKAKTFVLGLISERASSTALYRAAGILLVYYCVSRAPRLASVDSPLSDDELAPIYSDLGLGLGMG